MTYSLAERLRELRDLKDMTQEELATKTGITKAHIARIELGQIAEPKKDMLKRISKGLGVSLRELADPEWYDDEDPWAAVRRGISENSQMPLPVKRSFLTLLAPWYRRR
jgi:transcriptional regulator with XRE-family HTH domain